MEARRTGKNGFTLVEILVVLAILLFLAAISLPVAHRARNKATNAKTRTIIAQIEAALSLYENDFGDYPENQESGNQPLTRLLQGPVDNPVWKGPYLRVKQEDTDPNGNILDAWRTPLQYRYPQTDHENVQYTLVSCGPDREPGTADDIGNW